MKKVFVLICFLLLAGCSGQPEPPASAPLQINSFGTQEINRPASAPGGSAPEGGEGESGVDVEIKEKLFIAQINDIYLNADDYLGKTIKYEGIFDIFTWEEENLTYYSVIRYGPGCCADDGIAGFEVVWDGGYPNKNDWVEAVGVLEYYEENGWQILRLALTSLTVLETRGAEYVFQ